MYQQADNEINEEEELIVKELREAGLSVEDLSTYNKKTEEVNSLISTLESHLLTQDNTILDLQATYQSNLNYIAMLDAQIAENENAPNSNSQEILDKIANLKKEKAEVGAKNMQILLDIANAQQKKTEIKEKIELCNKEKTKLIEIYTQKCAEPDKVQNKIKMHTKNIEGIRIQRDKNVSEIQSSTLPLQVRMKDLDAQEARTAFIKENSYNSMQEVLDFGLSLDGKTASQMKEIMNSEGYAFYDKAWCGQFQAYIIDKTIGIENTADWYKNCSNRASCPTLLKEAQAAGAVVDNSEAQPGDLLLLTKENGHAYHVAMIVSINEDGSFNTIEGNTSDDNGNYTNGVVNQRHRKVNSGVVVRISE